MARRFTVSTRITAEDKASAPIAKVESRFQKLGSSIKASALKITAALATVVVAFRSIESSAEEIGQRGALEQTLARQGIAIDGFLAKLKELSDNQISSADLILASNRALKLGIEAADLPALLTTAANAAVDLGLSTTQAFNDITTGVGRASPLILDNLGIVIDATRIYADYAASIGTTTEELTKQQRTIAVTSAVIAQNADQTQDFSERQAELTRTINKGRAAFDNLTSSAGALTGALVQGTVSGLSVFVAIASLGVEVWIKFGRAITFVLGMLPGVGKGFEGLANSLKNADDGIDRFQKRAIKLATDLGKGAGASARFALGMEDLGEKADVMADKLNNAGGAANTAAGYFSTATDAAVGLGNALGVVTSAELELEIAKINEGLKESADKLGENSREYLRLEEIASEKIGSLQRRIESLRDGLGDLRDGAQESAGSLDRFGSAAVTAGADARGLASESERAVAGVAAIGRQAVTTAADFDRLAQSAGQAAAVTAALAGGATFSQGGRRIRFPGGSRLTSDPRTGQSALFSNLSGGTFSVPTFSGGGRRYAVLPNGRIEFL